jgi:molybdopterin/thiamine biosynthesis adenylyltransferase/rhodanese-related sulfurtransferase
MLNAEELARYARHLALPNFGIANQEKLKQSRVLVVGAGGLGSPVLLYLAAAGVGHIGIVDFDVVDKTNLQRQVLYTVEDIGQPKALVARQRLLALNPHIQVTVYQQALTSDNALDIVSQYDVVADGTDNFPTRYLVNDACVLAGKVNVYASIFRFEGQVAVFNYLNEDGIRSPNYRDLFPAPPPPNMVPNCAEGGVIGVLPGIIGSLQANEVIKVLTGIGTPLSGKLFLIDTADFSTRTLSIFKNPEVRIEELIDYDEFCGLPKPDTTMKIPSITVKELNQMRIDDTPHQLIDVREPYEYDIANLGGALIPPDQLEEKVGQIQRDIPVILQCRTGRRSADALAMLHEKFGFNNLYNLEGGIHAWADEIDPSVQKY